MPHTLENRIVVMGAHLAWLPYKSRVAAGLDGKGNTLYYMVPTYISHPPHTSPGTHIALLFNTNKWA